MSRDQFAHAKAVFLAARKLSGGARSAYLESHCAGDQALLAEAERLLAADVEPVEPVTSDGAWPGATRPAVKMPHVVPERIGRYRIRQVLDEGGMGRIYVAVQEHPRRTVALKVMKGTVASRSALRRFEYESQILARLRHPNIAQVYEAGVHEAGEYRVPYFAMEYVPNPRSLTEYAREKGLGTTERLELFAKVCDAVHHGHQKGIIHRDLKPGNILVDSSGEPKIIDFGVARATDSDLAVTTLQTDVGQLLGTLAYMSPEQCDADPEDLDVRSDVYALGVVLYELLTDRLPYDLTNSAMLEAVKIIRETPPIRPSTVTRTLRGDIETITLKTLEKDRRRRYRSAAELADDIDRYLRDQPIEARPPSITYYMTKYVRRHRAGVSIVALIGVAAILAVALAFNAQAVGAAEARAQTAEAQAAAKAARAELEAQDAANAARREEILSYARYFATELHDLIEELPGNARASKLIVDRALSDLERLRRGAPDDPEILLAAAGVYRQVGEVQAGLSNPGLGLKRDAAASYETAFDLVDRVLEHEPASREARRLEALVHLSQGKLLDDAKDFEASGRHVVQGLDLFRELAREDGEPELRRLEAMALNAVGKSLKRRGDPDAAQARYGEALAIFERLLAERPDDERIRRDVSVGYNRLGGAASGAEKRRLYERALRLREQALAVRPYGNRERRDVAFNHLFLWEACDALGDEAAAVAHLEQFLDLTLELAWESPFDDRAQRDLAYAHDEGFMTWVQAATGDLDRAALWYRLCERPLRRRAETKPATRDRLARNAELLGAVLVEQGRIDEGLERYAEAISISRRLVAEDPSAESRVALARQLTRHGLALMETDRREDARAGLAEAAALFDGAAPLDEENAAWAQRARQAIDTIGGG